MDNYLQFILPEGYDQQRVINSLSCDYIIKKRETFKSIVFYDTFDWRLFNKNLVLLKCGSKLFLRKFFKRKIIDTADIHFSPVFVWDLPDCELKNIIEPVIKMRALIRIAQIHSTSKDYQILNQDKKRLTSFMFEEIQTSEEKHAPLLSAYLWLWKEKNQSQEHTDLMDRLTLSGIERPEKDEIFFKAVKAAGRIPGQYSSKLKIKLDPEMNSDKAARVILQYLLQTIKINGIHIKNDLDTEFLHDFRVAVRRTRSLLSQIKSVFPKTVTRRFKHDFAFMGRLTSTLRDLDVCLLKEDTYRAALPDVLQDSIDPLFEHLQNLRTDAFNQVTLQLESSRYLKILNDWETFLTNQQQDSSLPSNADIPVIEIAQKRVSKQYSKIVKSGSRIIKDLEDEKLHDLRIKCKKLRYLMEFFTSLFKKKKIKVLIKQLKILQSNLGVIQDMYIQEQYLINMSKNLPVTNLQSKNTVMAVDILTEKLIRERHLAKEKFPEIFRNFASPKNKKAFNDLFVFK